MNYFIVGDAIEKLREMRDGCIQTCVTSPPYFGLRSYLPDRVRLKDGLDPDTEKKVLAELHELGVKPYYGD